MVKLVLDSLALIAYLRKEDRGAIVGKHLLKAKKGEEELFLSYINLAEVYYKIIRELGKTKADETLTTIKKIPVKLVSASDELVLKATEIKGYFSIALGDCFVVALALQENASILTGDPEFRKVAKTVKVKWLR